MKNLFACALALGLFAAVPAALAAPDPHKGNPHQGGTPHAGGHPAKAAHTSGGGGTMHGPSMSGPTHTNAMFGGTAHSHAMSGGPTHTNAMSGGTAHSHAMSGGPAHGNAMSGGPAHSNAMSGGPAHNNTMSGMSGPSHTATRSGHATVNFNRRNVTAQHKYHYRGGAYRGPSGYSYRRWNYGDILPSLYFGRDYWITDYYDYGLQEPPYGCEWIRYNDDALLIDEDTGEILEVVYGQFD